MLTAKTRLEVLKVDGEETTLRLTLTPRSFTRDGTAVTTPAEQRAELVAGPDGAIRRVLTVGGLPVDIAGGDISDLAPVIGVPLPIERVRLGQPLPRPTSSGTPPVYQGRVAGLRVIDGRDCAMIELGTRRPITRERDIGGSRVRLDGSESAHSSIAYAIRDGFAVSITTDAEGVFRLGSFDGAVTIVSHTTLTLAQG